MFLASKIAFLAYSVAIPPQLVGQGSVEIGEACRLAARSVGRPDLTSELRRIAVREGKYADGPHAGDAWASRRVYRAAVDRGWLDPECYDDPESMNWSTRGKHGLMAAYSLRFVPELGACPVPSALDHPGVSALAAARRAARCTAKSLWTGERVPCDCEERVANWSGVGAWGSRDPAYRWGLVRRQCGVMPAIGTVVLWALGQLNIA